MSKKVSLEKEAEKLKKTLVYYNQQHSKMKLRLTQGGLTMSERAEIKKKKLWYKDEINRIEQQLDW